MPGFVDLRDAVRAAAASAHLALDPAQERLIDRMAALGQAVEHARPQPTGLYIHGPAGRGKSWLADAFFAALPTTSKTRVHFHGFFDGLHQRIHQHRDEPDAVQRAIADVTGDSRFLLFDEFHVHDAGDARLLTRLLEQVFARDTVVFATSNAAPEALLPDPVWHHLFEPGIALLEAHMEVFPLDGRLDYRALDRQHPAGFAGGRWTVTAPSADPTPSAGQQLVVRGRRFQVRSAGGGRLEATFAQLCEEPLSAIEYLEWTAAFGHWTITDVPLLTDCSLGAQQRFINLVDVLVDADVTADMASAHPLDRFLQHTDDRPDGFRMASRLRLLRQDLDG